MDDDIEEIEEMLKPTKMKRKLFVTISATTIALSLLLAICLFQQIDYLVSIEKNHYTWFRGATKFIILLRLLAVFIVFKAFEKNELLLWNLSSTFVFISYFLSGVMNVYVIVVGEDLTKRVISVLLLLGEFILNCFTFVSNMVLTYQTIITTSTYDSTNLVNPQKEFILHGIETLITVLPGVGIFGKKLIKSAKVE